MVNLRLDWRLDWWILLILRKLYEIRFTHREFILVEEIVIYKIGILVSLV